MKTKIPKIPLVGPKGRRELIEKIEMLEKKIEELTADVEASAKEAAKVLTIPNYNGGIITIADKSAFCEAIGITTQQLDGLFARKYFAVSFPKKGGFYIPTYNSENNITFAQPDGSEDPECPSLNCPFYIDNGHGGYILGEY